MAEAIEDLPKRERLVLTLYYGEDLNLDEIGTVLGPSAARISQLCSATVNRLQAHLPRFQMPNAELFCLVASRIRALLAAKRLNRSSSEWAAASG